MKPGTFNRKRFLSTLGSFTAGGVLLNSMLPVVSHAQTRSIKSGLPPGEYLFSDGLTYLNTGTLGPCRRDTIAESQKMWEELESFPIKYYGISGAEAMAEKTRSIAARFLNCDISEMMITTSTTAGMNAIAQGLRLKKGDRILITDQEHSGGLLCWNYFAKYSGVIINKITVPPGENNAALILERVKDKLNKKTKLISLSHVFSSTGLRMPVAEISLLAREHGALCIVDGAQAAGAIAVDLKKLGCHAYATSGHKWLMGPKGTGLLYISKEAQDIIRPIQFEDSHNTYNNGNGVVNLPCILGLAKAIEYLESVGINEIEKHNLSLRNRLYDKLKDLKNVKILSPADESLSSPMLTLLLPARIEKGPFVKMLLDKYKISIRPTHKEFGFNGIRFSVHVFNMAKEIDFVGEVVGRELV